jgi:hypothetical protein
MRKPRWAIPLLLGLYACGGEEPKPNDASGATCGAWRAGPTLLDHREDSPAFLLPSGQALTVGGHFNDLTGEPVNTSELIDVAADKSILTSSFVVSRTTSGLGGTVMLADGRVLSASPTVTPEVSAIPAEIWDPTTGRWMVTGSQIVPGGLAVTLPDGRVLVAGGIDWAVAPGEVDTPLSRAEVWDVASGEWAAAPAMATARTGHRLVASGDRALAIGGFAKYPDGAGVGTSEAFDPVDGSWGVPSAMTAPRGVPAVAVLPDGRVLAAGGTAESGGYKAELASAEMYDPVSETWEEVAPMHEARALFTLTVLRDGRVLAVGGAHDSFSFSAFSVEIFDPQSNTWSRAQPMRAARRQHSAVLLPSGEVLVIGGDPARFSTEIYSPCE